MPITISKCNYFTMAIGNSASTSFDCDLQSSIDAAVNASAQTSAAAGSNAMPLSATAAKTFSESLTNIRVDLETNCSSEQNIRQNIDVPFECIESNNVNFQAFNTFGATARCAEATLTKAVATASAKADSKSGDTGLIIAIVALLVVGGVVFAIVKMHGGAAPPAAAAAGPAASLAVAARI